MITAIIPARGGSKSIRKKNLVNVCGKPLVEWTIEQALSSELVDRVIVSSDCHEIGAVSQAVGAEWIMRSDETASDTATSESALIEVLDNLDEQPELVVFLQPTSPIRQPDDIDNCIRTMWNETADSCFSARYVEGYTWTLGETLTPNYWDRRRRQTQSVARLEENGSIYVFKPDVLRTQNKRLGGKITFCEMHPLDSFQVDVPKDLELISDLMQLRLGVQPLTYTAI